MVPNTRGERERERGQGRDRETLEIEERGKVLGK